MIFQNVYKQCTLSINNDVDSAAFQSGHNSLIHIARKSIRYTAGDNEDVTFLEIIELLVESLDVFLCDVRSLAVDLRFLIGFNLDIDSGKTFLNLDKIGSYAEFSKSCCNFTTCKTCHKSECCALMTKILQNDRNIDSFSAGKNVFVIRTIDHTETKIFHSDNIIQRRVECYRVNHFVTSIIFSYFLYFLSVSFPVITTASSKSAKVTGDTTENLLRSHKIYLFVV